MILRRMAAAAPLALAACLLATASADGANAIWRLAPRR
jgi:hypothetical protein